MADCYNPQPAHITATEAASGRATDILFYGGSRSGKSYLACRMIAIRACEVPGSKHAIARRLFKDCRQKIGKLTLPTVLRHLGVPYTINKTDWIFELSNGSEIWICGLDTTQDEDTPDEAEKILGAEFSTILYEEADQIPYDAIETADTRLAEQNKLIKRSYFTCNPPSKSHWLYQKFFELKNPEDKSELDPADHAHAQLNPDDNRDNIDEGYFKRLDRMSKNKRKRFRDGEFTDIEVGKVFDQGDINEFRVRRKDVPPLDIIVIAIDPNVTSQKNSDDCGIILAGRRAGDNHIYILSDDTLIKPKTSEWAAKVSNMYHHHRANYIVAEVNQGGDLVKDVIRNYAREKGQMSPAIQTVHAKKGKFARAEPVGEMYELGIVHHVGTLEKLETQMTGFDPDKSKKSPDRMDALVYAVTALAEGVEVLVAGDGDDKTGVKNVDLNMQDVFSIEEMFEMEELWN